MSLSPTALLTLEEAKAACNESGNALDAEIEELIEAATITVEKEVGWKVRSRDYANALYDGSGGSLLWLRDGPISVVSKVEFLTSDAPEYWTEQLLATYPVTIVEPHRRAIYYRNNWFPKGRMNVRVSYTAGLLATDLDLHELQQAARYIVRHNLKGRERQDAGIASVSFDGQTAVRFDVAIPKEAKGILEHFRRRNIG